MPSVKKTAAPAEPAAKAASKAPATKPAAKFRLRITVGDVIAIGPGKIQLLEAIGETGSITSAAKSLDMSYRRAWLLLDELNHALRKPAVDSAKGGQNGGGSLVTDTGRQLIELYRGVEATAALACKPELTRLIGLLAR
ncbi:LysR family transcriptional regulator [soil metagenome]